MTSPLFPAKPSVNCVRCGTPVTDADCKSNTIEMPHDGIQCAVCNRLYFEQGTTYTIQTRYKGQAVSWTVREFSADRAEHVAKTAHAQEVNAWVGHIEILSDLAMAA